MLRLLPGLALAAAVAWGAVQLAEVIGTRLLGFERSPVSSVMVALLLGMLIGNLLPLPGWLSPGLRYSSRTVLRLGIILLGIRLSVLDVLRLGALGIPIVLVCIVGALLITRLLARVLGLPERLGLLIAVGTSICGVSAIGAAAPAIEAREEETAYAVGVITVFGILATFLYPSLAHWVFRADPLRAGLFLGTSVHDTSQVVGAGMVYGELYAAPLALQAAVVSKLVRNAFMSVVIPLVVLAHRRGAGGGGGTAARRVDAARLFPLFLIGFLALAAVRSVGDAGTRHGASAFGLLSAAQWNALVGWVQEAAGWCLVLALAAVGTGTRLATMRALGIRPFLAGLWAAAAVGVLAFTAISLLGAAVHLSP